MNGQVSYEYQVMRQDIETFLAGLDRKFTKKVLDKGSKTWEEQKFIRELECLIEELQSRLGDLKYYEKPAVEGRLVSSPYTPGRFMIGSEELTSGSSLELYIEKYQEWFEGRVESKNGAYYFYSYDLDHPRLEAGMRVRKRS